MSCDLIPRLNGLRDEFGIPRVLDEDADLRCLDICVPYVMLIHAFDEIVTNVPWPNAASSAGRDCRGIYDIPTGIEPTNCFFRVTCAEEAFTCTNGVATISVIVQGQLVLEYVDNGSSIFWVRDITVVDETLDSTSEWYTTDTGTAIVNTSFDNYIRLTDGSCLVINTSCEIDVPNEQTVVTASVVEKLWKYENIWVEGATPYLQLNEANTPIYENITIHEEFLNQAIPPCVTP